MISPRGRASDQVEMIDDVDVQILFDGRKHGCRKESFDPSTIRRENLKPWLIHKLQIPFDEGMLGKRNSLIGSFPLSNTFEVFDCDAENHSYSGASTNWNETLKPIMRRSLAARCKVN